MIPAGFGTWEHAGVQLPEPVGLGEQARWMVTRSPWRRQRLPLRSSGARGGGPPRPLLAWLLLAGTASGRPGRRPTQSQPRISPLRPALLPLFSPQELPGCEGQRRVVWEGRPPAQHAPCVPGCPWSPPSRTLTQSHRVRPLGTLLTFWPLETLCRLPGHQKEEPRSRARDAPYPDSPGGPSTHLQC